MIALKLAESGWSLYASEAYRLAHPAAVEFGALAGHDVIGFDASLAHVAPARWLAEHGAGACIVLRNREMTDMTAAAAQGVGLALLPCILGDRHPALQRLSRAVLVSQSLCIVYRREARLSPQVCAVIEFVKRVVKTHAKALSGERDEK